MRHQTLYMPNRVDLVAVNIETLNAATREFNRLTAAMGDAGEGILVQKMIKGERERVMGIPPLCHVGLRPDFH